jgi:hypothetical protein
VTIVSIALGVVLGLSPWPVRINWIRKQKRSRVFGGSGADAELAKGPAERRGRDGLGSSAGPLFLYFVAFGVDAMASVLGNVQT